MKKTLSILIIAMLIIVSNIGMVSAADKTQDALYIELSTEDNASKVATGSTVSVAVDIKGFKTDKLAITTLNAEVDYDRTVFESIDNSSFKLGDGWSGLRYNDLSGLLIIDYGSAQIEDTRMGFIQFKVKDTAKLGNTTITLKSLVASDGHEDIQLVEKSISFTVESSVAAPTPTPTAAPTAVPTAAPTAAPTAKTSTVPTIAPTAKASAMPQTGIEGLEVLQVYALPIIVAVAVIGVFAYVKYNRMDK